MKIIRLFIGLCLLAGTLALYMPATALAADNPPPTPTPTPTPPPDKIELTATYPTLEATSGGNYEFEVKLTYTGSQPRTFNLAVTGPKDWDLFITPSYPKDKRIKDIRIDPNAGGTETILVEAAPAIWLNPDPGNNTVTLSAAAADVKGSISLTAVVTARYSLSLAPPDSAPYSTTVTAGAETSYSVDVKNDGTSTIENITFTADKPEGWTVTFSPEKVDSLLPFKTQALNAKIKPAAKAIAGDYVVSVRATGKQATATKLDVRVTVQTSTIWGWTGVAIIVLVVAGLGFVIMSLSRR